MHPTQADPKKRGVLGFLIGVLDTTMWEGGRAPLAPTSFAYNNY